LVRTKGVLNSRRLRQIGGGGIPRTPQPRFRGFRDPEKRKAWNARSHRNAHRFGVESPVAGLNLQHDSVVMERLHEIEVPTLALAGDEDLEMYGRAAAYLERKMPNARRVEIAGGKHLMHEETHAAEIAALVADFVGELEREV